MTWWEGNEMTRKEPRSQAACVQVALSISFSSLTVRFLSVEWGSEAGSLQGYRHDHRMYLEVLRELQSAQ